MTLKETAQIITMINVFYPDTLKDKSAAEREMYVKGWHRMFEKEPVALVTAAVDAYVTTNTSGFAPNIGQLKEQIRKLVAGDEITDGEAWSMVFKAIKRSLYESEEQFAKLPETIQRCVGSPKQLRQWALMEEEVVNSVIASNFQKTYRGRKKDEEERIKLPESSKLVIAGIADKMRLESGDEKG